MMFCFLHHSLLNSNIQRVKSQCSERYKDKWDVEKQAILLPFLYGIDDLPYQSPLVQIKAVNGFGKSSESFGHANERRFVIKTMLRLLLNGEDDKKTKVGSVVNGNDNFVFNNHWI